MSIKTIDRIFIINENGVLEINKPEIRNIPEFKAILTRDKGKKVKGDPDGRKKFFAFKELMFVYLYTSMYSKIINMPDNARYEKAKKDADLEKEWKQDNIVKLACKKLQDIENLSPLRHAYINAKKAIYSIGEDIVFFNKQKESIRNRIKIAYSELESAIEEEQIQKLEHSIETNSNKLLSLGSKILGLGEQLPKSYELLKDFEKKLLEEQNGKAAIYGGGVLGNRES